jgi:hypothetical protein
MIESKKQINDIHIEKSSSLSAIYNQLSTYKNISYNITSPIIQLVANKNIKRHILVSPDQSPIIQLKPSKQFNEYKQNKEFTRLVSSSPKLSHISMPPELSPINQIIPCKNLHRCIPPIIRPMPSPELSPIVQVSPYKNTLSHYKLHSYKNL